MTRLEATATNQHSLRLEATATYRPPCPMIDIHCHLLPELDDGPASWDQSIAMARMAVMDGTETIIVTPHQLGGYRNNSAALIRERLEQMRRRLQAAQIPLKVLAGADVRIEPDLIERLQSDDVLSLGDQGRHVLLELPHELYFPLEPVLKQLRSNGMTGILSHPERNHGLLADPSVLEPLVKKGCLMQITAASLLGAFGRASQRMAESMLKQGLVHFVASDGHGTDHRRPRLRKARERVEKLTDSETAEDLFQRHPAYVCAGRTVPAQHGTSADSPRRWLALSR